MSCCQDPFFTNERSTANMLLDDTTPTLNRNQVRKLSYGCICAIDNAVRSTNNRVLLADSKVLNFSIDFTHKCIRVTFTLEQAEDTPYIELNVTYR